MVYKRVLFEYMDDNKEYCEDSFEYLYKFIDGKVDDSVVAKEIIDEFVSMIDEIHKMSKLIYR